MQSIAVNQTITSDVGATNKPDLDLADLFQAHYPRIYNYLRYRVSAVEDAEDLISLVFERAYTRRDRFDPEKGSFSTWLFRIAHNTLVDHYRSRERRSTWESDRDVPVDLVVAEPSPESQMVQKETVAQLLQCLTCLSERDQEIISLKFAGKLRNKEIGKIMDMKEKTVSVVLLRAIRRLRQQMVEEAVHE